MTSGMKETSSPWMPEVPELWTVLPARYCVTSRQNGSWGESPLNEGEGEFCLRAADFDYEHLGLKPRESYTRRVYSEAEFERVKVRHGDLIVEKSGGGEKTPVGRAVLIKNPIDVAFSNFLERLTVDSLKCIPEFFAYWWTAGYQSASFVPFFNQTTGIQNLNITKLLVSNVIALPESEEQYAIVELLDEECAKIDQAIDLLQQELDALEQLKKSIIYEAVTKGLDPAVPMKPSGVEWIGDIPEHWGTTRIKYIAPAWNGLTYDPADVSDTGTPVLRSGNIQNGELDLQNLVRVNGFIPEKSFARSGDILICSRNGSRNLIGKNALISQDGYAFGAFMMIARPVVNSQYFYYLLNSGIFDFYLPTYLTSTVNQLTGTNFGKMIVPIADDPDEQLAIVEELNTKCKALDVAAEKKRTQLCLLRKQRDSLIFEYVTGKRRVSEVA